MKTSLATSTNRVTQTLGQELDGLRLEINRLENRAEAIQGILDLYANNGEVKASSTGIRTAPTSKHLSGRGRKVGARLQKKQARKSAAGRKSGDQPTTLDMIRHVLLNAGKALSRDEIKAGVLSTYKLSPSSSWEQMLYKRSRDKSSGFYKTNDGRFGLKSQKARVETVASVESPVSGAA